MTDNIFPIFEKKKQSLPAFTRRKRPYAAFMLGDALCRETRLCFEISDKPENFMVLLPYSLLVQVACSFDDTLNLTFSNDTMMTVRGSKLGKLLPHLQNESLKSLEIFKSGIHLLPEPDQVFIRAVELRSFAEYHQYTQKLIEECVALGITPHTVDYSS